MESGSVFRMCDVAASKQDQRFHVCSLWIAGCVSQNPMSASRCMASADRHSFVTVNLIIWLTALVASAAAAIVVCSCK